MSDLYDPSVWGPALDAVRAGAPPDATRSLFVGSRRPLSFGGRTLDDGVGFRASGEPDPMRILGELSIDVPPNGIGVTLATWPDGRDEVMAWEWPASVGSDVGRLIGDLLLRADRRLDPYRPDPDQSVATGPSSPSPTADADAVLALVASLLPGAGGVSDARLDAVEAEVGSPLPADVRALYAAASEGDVIVGGEDDAFYGFEIVPLDDHTLRNDAPSGVFVVGHDWGGNLYAADLTPGTFGRIVLLDHEQTFRAFPVADSLTDLLRGRVGEEPQPRSGSLDDRREARINDRSGVSVDADVPELRVLSLGKLSQPAELAPLTGHAGLRSLNANHGTIVDLEIVASFPSLEHLALAPEEWRRLLDSDLVPTTLVTAAVNTMGIHDPRPSIAVANEILRRWDRPEIEVRTVIEPGRGRGGAPAAPSSPPSHPGLLGRLGRRRRG
ncbi:MAG: SMI1/KNR4 family protein [Actinomycetota bacterium]|nr:SMI1/KNR4 family protein [Actinomycetota bacterium]